MTTRGKIGQWLLVPRPRSSAKHQLYCFPYAGGGASVYEGWGELLPNDVEVVVVQPPGRESRLLEPSYRDLRALTLELLAHIPDRALPFSFYGHSMGAFIAFELTQQLKRDHRDEPTRLFVSASRAPHVPDPDGSIHELPDREFLTRLLERYDGIPSEVLESDEFMELLLPKLKADLQMVETYSVSAEQARLSVPITCYGGDSDKDVDASQLSRWQELTSAKFGLKILPGGHFFLESRRDLLLESLAAELESCLRNSK